VRQPCGAAANLSGTWKAWLSTSTVNAMDRLSAIQTENGAAAPSGSDHVWTGTQQDGTDGTAGATGATGRANLVSGKWTLDATSNTCNNTLRLSCFEK
jgi:hypothetical protein